MMTTDENQTTVVSVQPAAADGLNETPIGDQRRSSKTDDVVTDIQQAELLKNIRSALSKFNEGFQVNRPVSREILQESQDRFTEIMGIINHRLQQAEADRAKLEAEIDGLRSQLSDAAAQTNRVLKQVSALQAEKSAIEQDMKKAASESQIREQEVTHLKSELANVQALLEAAIADKTRFEKKLNQFQEQWDKFVAGS